MNKFNKILADHDDVYSHGTILYTDGSGNVYADKACTVVVEGETLKDIYLKGCVVATVTDGVVSGPYTKPTSLEVVDDGVYQLGFASAGGSSDGDLAGGASQFVVTLKYSTSTRKSYVDKTHAEIKAAVEAGYTPVLKCSDFNGSIATSTHFVENSGTGNNGYQFIMAKYRPNGSSSGTLVMWVVNIGEDDYLDYCEAEFSTSSVYTQ